MQQPLLPTDAFGGTAGGSMLVILANISAAEMLHTALLAGIGAVVSFGVSLALKTLIKKWRR